MAKMDMVLDFTGLIDDGGFVELPPGRYDVVTKPEWSIKRTANGENLSLRVPFTVTERNEFEAANSSFFHTIMLKGAADKVRQNKLFTLRLLTALGIVTDEDRGPKGELQTSWVFGDENDYGSTAITGIKVNGQSRSLGGRVAVAVSVVDDKTSSGLKVKALEAKGSPSPGGNAGIAGVLSRTGQSPVREVAIISESDIPF